MKTLIIAAAVIGLAAPVHAEEPAPTYSYPPCYQDPDVTCMSQPGDPESYPSYESGHYPEGWYDQRYENDKPNTFRQAELAGKPYVASVQSEPVYYQPEPIIESVTLYTAPAGPVKPKTFLEELSELLGGPMI